MQVMQTTPESECTPGRVRGVGTVIAGTPMGREHTQWPEVAEPGKPCFGVH